MTLAVILLEPLGERSYAATDFPLSIGGTGSDVNVRSTGETVLAWLGQHDGKIFVQPADGAPAVRLNGAPIDDSAWLRSGDVIDVGGGRLTFDVEDGRIVLSVVDGAVGNLTVPPEADLAVSVSGAGPADEEPIEAIAFTRQQNAVASPRDTSTPRRALVAVGIGLLVALAAYIFTSVPVQVAIEPAPETMAFEGGWPGLHFGASHLLRPGAYTLVAEKPGYRPLRESVEITADRNQRLSFNLTELPGRLSIELPVPGQVSIDGSETGEAPGEFLLDAGTHQVLIRTERYLDFDAEVAIAGKGERQVLQPELVPGWSRVSISSEPAGADLLVGGQAKGVTPLEIELMAGSHSLEIRREGYKPWIADIQTKANEPLRIGPVRLGIPDGRLTVRSKPSGASVTIGGAYKGRTPLSVELRPDVTMPVMISRDGYQSAERSVSVGSDRQETIDVALKAILGEVIVSAKPADAALFIDGVAHGTANQTLMLAATDHKIEIRSPGFAPFRTTVTPRPGLTQRVEVTLLKGSAPPEPGATVSRAEDQPAMGEPPGARSGAVSLAAVIRSSDGQELRLLPAGSYTMGSARREAGRRSNEGMRPVELRRRVYLSTREVSNAEFRQFRPGHRSGYVGQSTLDLDRQPVVNVSWQDAVEYCNWLSAKDGLEPAYDNQGGRLVPVEPMTTGYRLPTEAEWEWAARAGPGGLKKYPWGDSLPVPAGAGNYADSRAQPIVQQVLADLDDGHAATAPVGSFQPNAMGYFDLGGNVAEWTHDLYTVQGPGGSKAVDPMASEAGAVHGIRGSSWRHASVTQLRLTFRDYGDGKRNDVGFRIARYAQ